jgi:hypothetical protein
LANNQPRPSTAAIAIFFFAISIHVAQPVRIFYPRNSYVFFSSSLLHHLVLQFKTPDPTMAEQNVKSIRPFEFEAIITTGDKAAEISYLDKVKFISRSDFHE